MIARWEQDYGKPDPACENVVRESLVRLWSARRGLSESELLESLGTKVRRCREPCGVRCILQRAMPW